MRIIKFLGLGLIVLLVFMVGRTFVLLPSSPPVVLQMPENTTEETARIAANLTRAIQYRTISHGDDVAPDSEAFRGFHDFLAETYPAAHQVMTREVVSDYSLFYRWPAAQASDKKPIAFLAHIDVVPVPEEGLGGWYHDPYAGVVDGDGILWGRGAMDDKGMLIALMETAERLANAGFTPDRDIYFLFGHDEELGGEAGAAVMASMLKDRGVQLSWVLDEGSVIVEGAIPGVQSPVALISLGEKGSVTLKFSAEDEGGHSSAPKAFTAASLAAKAGHLVTEEPYPLVLDEHLEAFLKAVAPEMGFANRLAIANLWATRPLLAAELAKSPTTAAFMHTTTALTMMKAGTKSNVLPQYGEVTVNYRIHPRDTVDGVIERARAVVGDERIRIENLGGKNATRMSSPTGEGYLAIAQAITETFGPIPTAPTLTIGGTDARHFYAVADDVYRFMPMVMKPDDIKRMHGTNEYIHVDALAGQVSFFENLVRGSASPDGRTP